MTFWLDRIINPNGLSVNRYKHENETPLSDADVGKRWLKKCDGGGRLQKQSAEKSTLNLQYTVTNGPYTNAPSNPVLQAFVNAYNNHEDLILCPDDIWSYDIMWYSKRQIHGHARRLEDAEKQNRTNEGIFGSSSSSLQLLDVESSSVVDESTGTEKMCSVIGGFHGVNREDHAYKPVMSLAVVEDLSTVKPMKS
ncbi:unnamed protein product [Didymodactylos carnosus]|uniref:Uncharacterized protein n=2 Tax=Didymodactylos carnosus TaxID=1234261 RepID=A0A814WCQ5_9BILA|nr:unnamed protein product [Didymodactylos carnosus]CAF3965171.1 unnamed protein product [Didymodactylos carnosus]